MALCSVTTLVQHKQQKELCKHTNPSEATEASQHLVVDEAALGRVSQGLVQQVVDEVYARLHGKNHPFLHQAAHPKTLQSRLVNSLDTLYSS